MSEQNPKPETVKLKVMPPEKVAKPAPAKGPKPKVVKKAAAVVEGALLKKPDFLDRAITRAGVKRRDAKPAIEAALQELAAALLRGDELNLPPLGKIKVMKARDLGDGAAALTLKVRTMKDDAGQGKSGVAEDDQDG